MASDDGKDRKKNVPPKPSYMDERVVVATLAELGKADRVIGFVFEYGGKIAVQFWAPPTKELLQALKEVFESALGDMEEP
jgi:hypothetical protein